MSNAVSTTWPSGSTNQGWPQEPSAMLMPGRVQGWPAGTQRAANPATTLLSQAVAWWDVEQYREGDRFLRNRGTGGELLDLRLGSSSTVATSNDPLYLAPEDQGYVYLPGVAGNYLSVPDAPAVSITGDIDIRAKVNLTTWAPATGSSYTFVSKWNNSPQNSYWLTLLDAADGNKLRMHVSSTGSDTYSAASSVAPGFSPGTTAWVRATYATASGEVKFYTSTDDATTWTQLGTTQTTTAVAIYDGTQRVEIGSFQGQSTPLVGRVYRAQILNGINGTTALDIDCDAITSGSATSFTAVTNQTVNVNVSSTGRKAVCMPSRFKRGAATFLMGLDDYMDIPAENGWQHNLLNFAPGDSFTAVAAYRLKDASGTSHQSRIISKRAGGSPTVGWSLHDDIGPPVIQSALQDVNGNTTFATILLGSYRTTGGLNVAAIIRDAAARRISTANVGRTTVSAADTTTASTSTTEPFAVGYRSNSSANSFTGEFYFAAVFRNRVLSANELKVISDYATGRIA